MHEHDFFLYLALYLSKQVCLKLLNTFLAVLPIWEKLVGKNKGLHQSMTAQNNLHSQSDMHKSDIMSSNCIVTHRTQYYDSMSYCICNTLKYTLFKKINITCHVTHNHTQTHPLLGKQQWKYTKSNLSTSWLDKCGNLPTFPPLADVQQIFLLSEMGWPFCPLRIAPNEWRVDLLIVLYLLKLFHLQ